MGLLSLVARLGLDATGFNSGLKRSQSAAERFGRNVNSSIKGYLAGAFAVGVVGRNFFEQISKAGEFRKQAQALGISTEELQKYKYAADQTNASYDGLLRANQRFAQALARARDGEEAYLEPLERLGFLQEDIANDDLSNSFLKLGDRVKDLTGKTQLTVQQSSDLQDVLGRNAREVIPVMQAGLREMGNEAENLGLIIEDDLNARFAQMGDRMTTLTYRINKLVAGPLDWLLKRLEQISTVMQIAVAPIASAAGNMSVTGSFSEGRQAYLKTLNKVVDDYIKHERAIQKGFSKGSGLPPDHDDITGDAGRIAAKAAKPSLANLGRVGIFTAQGEATRSIKQSLRNIEKSNEEIADHTDYVKQYIPTDML